MSPYSPRTAIVGAQMLFVAFGALVLVPILTGLDPNVALFTAGIGTLLFQLVTKGQVPIFLASSFAFIPAISHGVATWGIASTMSGLMAAGVLYMFLSGLVAIKGTQIIHRILPPIVVGPVIMVIGLSLAPVAVHMALGKTGDGSATLFPIEQALMVSMPALIVTILVSLLGKGLLRLIPILAGLIVGYSIAVFQGMVNFAPMTAAPWFAIPNFTTPEFNWEAILFIVPIAIAPAVEHIGDMVAISNVTGKDFLKKPGLKKTLLGDGIATTAASLFGGPPNTTYSEVTGAVALTRSFNPVIMIWAAVFAIALSFCGKSGALLSTIPTPVMGGIMTLLFGAIASVGLNTLVKAGDDISEPRNLTIVALTLVFGLGGMFFEFGDFALRGIALAAILAIVLNLILPKGSTEKTH
ncbi:uracil-xanthine permease family protein [Echinimonas agarilytica]|uniref:Uracil-xanthine permease family protein n=1 Tax=Echinimonas agarilytica TaxID=1215918 RepID=A0AA41W4L5_9GAMM|nr:uracil-xanthine permease family protein [Echinimonas agarilytica]MCM2678750.1 uracil-xanthine permease family protein [Echinimonas agarilytica]